MNKDKQSSPTTSKEWQSPTQPLPLWVPSSDLPPLPGVYWWLDGQKNVIYVGKAKNLRNRLNSYRHQGQKIPKTREMTAHARFLQWKILRSELEALLVEAELINRYQPPYNVLLKDDKSPLYLVITQEEWPRVLRLRRRDLLKNRLKGKIFGPFPSSYKVTEVLKLVRPIFPWCNAPRKQPMHRCFENHLGLCPGVCTGDITQAEYRQIMDQLALFLSGKTHVVTKRLQKQMLELAEQEKFEQAAAIRDKLKLIAEITSETHRLRQDYFLPNLSQSRNQDGLIELRHLLSTYQNLPREYELTRIEGYDVSNTSGQLAVVSMVVFTDGQPDNREYRTFNIKTLNTPNDFAMMSEALARRARRQEDWPQPQLLLIDGGKGQVRSVLQTLITTPWEHLPVIGIAKDPDRLVIPQIISPGTGKRLKISWQVLNLGNDDLALQLCQQIRDEAHRFGKSHHVKRRLKSSLQLPS
ncbi:GIY-YIG nuclease family protein [bacterium]|nr:GIY-YIG nuclease family protein [bacterium]